MTKRKDRSDGSDATALQKNRGGRPSTYSPERAARICAEIACGKSVREVCRMPDMPSMDTVFAWLAKHEDFRAAYSAARGAQADYLAEEMLEIADDARNDWMTRQTENGRTITVVNGEHIQRSRVRIDTRKWLLAKLQPKKYGDLVQAQVSGPGGAPIRIENALAPLAELAGDELALLRKILERRAGVAEDDEDDGGADAAR